MATSKVVELVETTGDDQRVATGALILGGGRKVRAVSSDRVEVLARVRCRLGEGPFWHPTHGVLWVDILPGIVWRCTLGGAPEVLIEHHEPIGCLALAGTGELLGMTQSGLWRLEPEPALLVAQPDAAPDRRPNDGQPDPAGRYLVGTMTFPKPSPGAGVLWSYDTGGPRPMLDDLTIPNGLAWWTDPASGGVTMYYVDTPTGDVRAYEYDVTTGALGAARTLASVHPSDGAPDGIALDREGGLWVALNSGGKLHRYDPSGVLTGIIELPVADITCPAFVGERLDRLVVTSATEPFENPDDAPPGAGDVFLVDPGVEGAPVGRVDLTRLLAA